MEIITTDELLATIRGEGQHLGAAARTDPDAHHLPEPGPETVMRDTTSDLLLALWHRRDPVSLHTGGDGALLERWPHV